MSYVCWTVSSYSKHGKHEENCYLMGLFAAEHPFDVAFVSHVLPLRGPVYRVRVEFSECMLSWLVGEVSRTAETTLESAGDTADRLNRRRGTTVVPDRWMVGGLRTIAVLDGYTVLVVRSRHRTVV